MPMIRHALATRRDPLTGQPLSWLDFTRTVEVASRIALPPQQPFEDGPGIAVQLIAPHSADEWPPAPPALPPTGDKTKVADGAM